MSTLSPIAATRGVASTPSTESPADAAGGSTNEPWLATVPAGWVAVTNAAPAESNIDLSVYVVTPGALRLWLDRWAKRTERDPAKQAAAIRGWLSGQRHQGLRLPYRMWCAREVARLASVGIEAAVHAVPGTDLCAVIRRG